MSFWLRLGGYSATEIAAHSRVTWETWADGGSGSASWAFALTIRSQHQALRVGSLVEVMCGLTPVWSGLMSDPDRTTWECTAYGLASAAQNYPAIDGALANTRDVGVAIAQAQAMGWPVLNPFGVGGIAAGDADGNPAALAKLLDDYAQETGQRWGVDGRRCLFMRPDPTSPTWLASPGAAVFGSTSEGRATRLLGRYLDSGTGTNATASAGSGTPFEAVDLTERGAMTGAEATAILAGALAREHTGPAWTNGVNLTRGQLQTMGGTPAFLPAVVAGGSMRSFGLANSMQALALDTVIGKTRYTEGDDVIYVEPVNTAPRSLSDVIATT